MNAKRPITIISLLILGGLLMTACLPAAEADPTPTIQTMPTETSVVSQPTASPERLPTESPNPEPSSAPETDIPDPTENPHGCDDPFGDASIRFPTSYWTETNFCLHSIDYGEVLSGGPPPDGIPPLDNPQFESIGQADAWLGEGWPVMIFVWNGQARAYPLAILMWHEIVNDTFGDFEVALTFCPLCNATIAFNRTLDDGTVLDFGTSGNLRNSDLIMYDRQTFSWWQQFTGEAIVGDYTGTQLEFLPSQIISWADFKENFPDGEVLSRNTGYNRDYGRNPYVGYDNINSNPFLYDGVVDGRLAAMERVVAIDLNQVDVAYPFSELEKVNLVNDTVGDTPVVVFWQPGTQAALDAISFDDSRDIGSTAVFERTVGERVLTFAPLDVGFMDLETESVWNQFGVSTDGPLAGTQLTQVVSAEHFWFAWAAFKPDTIIWQADDG